MISEDKFVQFFSLNLLFYCSCLQTAFKYAMQKVTHGQKNTSIPTKNVNVCTYLYSWDAQMKTQGYFMNGRIQFMFAFVSSDCFLFSPYLASSFDFII